MTGFSEAESVTLDMLKNKMAEFARERNWEKFHSPRNLLLAMVCAPSPKAFVFVLFRVILSCAQNVIDRLLCLNYGHI